jgi:putative ABC transport system permease protein
VTGGADRDGRSGVRGGGAQPGAERTPSSHGEFGSEPAHPPDAWTRILRLLLRGEEGERVVEALAELYAERALEGSRAEAADGWYRRQVIGFALRLPALSGRRGWFPRRRHRMERMRQDLSFTVRQLARRPGFALLAVLTSALGIGAATAIFALVRAVVLDPLPYPGSDALVSVVEMTPSGDDFSTSEPNVVDFAERSRTLSGLAAYTFADVAARLGDGPVQLRAMRATPSFFDVLAAEAAVGRVYTADEGGPQPAPVAVLSHAFWRDAYGSAGDVVGRTIVLDGIAHTVIGIMPAGWEPFGDTDLWVPQRLDPSSDRGDHMLDAVARLAAGQSIASAQADLGAIQEDLSARFPQSNGGWGVDVRPLRNTVVGEDTIQAGWVLLGAVGLLLLLSCASVSNLLIARATERRREIAVRTAIGASAGRVLRQLMTESLALALAGGTLGVLIAFAAVPVLQSLSPPGTPRIDDVRVDLLVLLFAVGVSVAAGLLFGVAPALQTRRSELRAVLLEGGRTSTGSVDRVRGALVVAQVAIAFTLLVGVGLLATSFLRFQDEDTGLAVEETLAVPLTLPWERYDVDDRIERTRAIAARVAAIPGVRAAGFSTNAPFGDWNTVNELAIEGVTYPENEVPYARWRGVTAGYFAAAGVAIIAGRGLEPSDRGAGSGDRAVAVVTRTMADRVWGSPAAALGRRLAMGRDGTNWLRVVGVAADVEDNIVAETAEPVFFFPDGGWWPMMTLIVRADADPITLAPAIRAAIAEIDADLPVPTVERVADRLARQAAAPRFRFLLMLTFGAVALALALMGVYGVTHLAVSRRTRELGIRYVLGASTGGILRMVVTRSALLALVGVGLGVALVAAGATTVQAILFRTRALDPAILAAAAGAVVAAAIVAAWIPARRVSAVDPVSVLRAD